MTRFDDHRYLDEYRELGIFPSIHRPLADLIVSEARGTRFIDLGACTGLLGQQVLKRVRGSAVVGVEACKDFVLRGEAAGIEVPTMIAKLTPETAPHVAGWIQRINASVLIARRCLPEIFGDDAEFRGRAAALFYDAGIREIFIEGRVATKRATNELCDIVKEVALFTSHYRLAVRRGACAYLVAKE
jgi:hypothetical protein